MTIESNDTDYCTGDVRAIDHTKRALLTRLFGISSDRIDDVGKESSDLFRLLETTKWKDTAGAISEALLGEDGVVELKLANDASGWPDLTPVDRRLIVNEIHGLSLLTLWLLEEALARYRDDENELYRAAKAAGVKTVP